MTTRGFADAEAEQLGNLIADVLDAPHDAANLNRVRGAVTELCHRLPVYATELGQEPALVTSE
jgi:glycine/serine hydroxymethyltransferase